MATVVPDVLARSSVTVVDDTEDNVALLRHVLEDAGVGSVRTYTDPRDALRACLEQPPDLILLDLHMPNLDGIQFMAALQSAIPAGTFLPVAVLTADITRDTRRRVLAAGAKDFLTKPLDIGEVILRARNLLETRELYRQLEEHNATLQAELATIAAAEEAARTEEAHRNDRIDAVLATHAFHVVYQPIVDIDTDRVVGAEALTRFDVQPPRPPDVWFAEAVSVGRDLELELAAITSALGDLEQLPPGAFLSLNASPKTAASPDFAAAIRGSDPRRIVVELTEHDRVDDYSALNAALDGLRAQGLRIAVDDTGAGYASLNHILLLRAEILKLDIGLTRGIDHDPVRRSLAGSLVTFAQDVGSTIIAEGVENEAELAALRDLGVRWIQGYHLAAPADPPIPHDIASAQDGRPDLMPPGV